MKTNLFVLFLIGMVSTATLAESPRPAKRSAATARKAANGKPLPPARPMIRLR